MNSQLVLKAIGYWEPDASLASHYPPDLRDLPHPRDLVDVSWENADKARILRYLRAGVRWNRYLGYSWCRFEGGPPAEEMGTSDLSDGVWLWPEGLHVYVGQFHVRLPDEFVAHMRKNAFVIPSGLSRASFPEHRVDLSFWKNWAEEQKRKRSRMG